MSLTYVNFKMIEQPIEELSAVKFQTNSLVVQSLTAASINTRYNVAETIIFDKIFSNEDSSKAFHADTGFAAQPITISFPNTLSDGFNVTILNVDSSLDQRGSETITISSDPLINTINQSRTNSTTNTGMLIYKYNGQFYGVGTFD